MMAAVGGHTTLDRLLLRRRACALRLLLADDGVDLHLVRHIGADERRVMGCGGDVAARMWCCPPS